MGRQVRRVPVDFDWPIDKTWQGFLTPDALIEDPCPDCHTLGYRGDRTSGSGATAAHRWLEAICHLICMLADDVDDQKRNDGVPVTHRVTGAGGTDRMHPYLQDLMRINVYEHRRPSADIVALVNGLSGTDGTGILGRSTTDSWRILAKIVEAAGLDEKWGHCPTCDGHGTVEAYEGQRAKQEAWEETEPPTGDGWQLWETVSEGSPISPVFDTPEGLAQWMSSPAYTWGASSPMTYESAFGFVTGAGWAPTMVVGASGLVSGEQWVADQGIRS